MVVDQRRAHQVAVALARLDRDHALGAAAVAGVFGDRRTLAVAVLGRRQHRTRLVLGDEHAHHARILAQAHAAHAGRLAAHRAHVVFGEADRLAVRGEQHHVALPVGERHADQVVALVEAHGDDPGGPRPRKSRERRLLHRAMRGRHEDEVLVVELAAPAPRR